ncbi:MAG: UDP-N-acetylmuramate dehydrogenase [Chlorobi bacterium]|nr:UDP-N-acetylmuramate dehydrogenase [Chlorobiota bacterium]
MTIEHNVDSSQLTTFRTRGAVAEQLYHLETVDDVVEFARYVAPQRRQWLVLGGGSNMLLVHSVECAARVEITDRRIIEETASRVILRLGAGLHWHSCVEWAVANGWAGIEAMALIPGTVGAAPIQNIGAYGQQLSDVCRWVEGVDVYSGRTVTLAAQDCHFGYRDSVFKRERKGNFIITAIGVELEKRTDARVAYDELARRLTTRDTVTISDIFETVVTLRRGKLPPDDIGSAGSFFKNPVVELHRAAQLAERYPDMPRYQQNGAVKLSAGWLIEQCGYKGIRRGDAGVYDRHALVLVNYGTARGEDILRLAAEIKAAVHERFGVELEEEVIIV